MPTVFPNDLAVLGGCSGGGSGPASINNQLLPALGSKAISIAHPISDEEFIYCADNAIYAYNRYTNKISPFYPQPANWLWTDPASGGWVRRLANPPAVTGSYGDPNSTLRPMAINQYGLLACDWNTATMLSLVKGQQYTNLISPSTVIYNGEGDMDGNMWVARISPGQILYGSILEPYTFKLVNIPESVNLSLSFPYVYTWAQGSISRGIIVNLSNEEYSVLPAGLMYNVQLTQSGLLLKLATSYTAGEAPGTNSVLSFNPAEAVWVGGATEDYRCLLPHPVPAWIAPYHQITDRWGDAPVMVGNASIMVPEDSLDKDPMSKRVERMRRAQRMGRPMVVHPEMFFREFEDLCIANYLHCPDPDTATGEVMVTLNRISQKTLPDAPTIVYIDSNKAEDWDDLNVPKEWCWLSPQCYRDAGESMYSFRERVTDLIMSLLRRKYRVIPTWHAFDRNSPNPIRVMEALETYEVLATVMKMEGVVGFLPFTHMRGNEEIGIGGMDYHPEIMDMVIRFILANPQERPNRYSYYRPQHVSMKEVLNNKLGQTRLLKDLDPAETQVLLDLVNEHL